ncbi:Rab GDP dissociation inhibitor alpha [Hanseniaspora osmophila]
MEENYDVIVLGTGLTECILSGLLSIEGKKVLHIDRQEFYGGESASVNLTELYKRYKPEYLGQHGGKIPEKYGRDRDWNVDLIPKFLMSNGELTNILIHTDVTRYVEFKQISGSYVYHKNGKIYKVPANEMEAISSPLLGIFEKRRVQKFLEWVSKYRDNDTSTHHGLNLDNNTMEEVYYKFGLGKSTQDFVGHAMALYPTDEYLQLPCRPTVERIILYSQSVARYGKSPYLYPLYGLGELPQGFARLSAIYGGTYMLGTPVEEVYYTEENPTSSSDSTTAKSKKFAGVKTKEGIAKAPLVIADPSYFPDLVEPTGEEVIRCICILNHPVSGSSSSDSVQIILPQNQIGRNHDIYIAMVGESHHVSGKNYYLAIVSTIVETKEPLKELEPALKLLGEIEDKFVGISKLMKPKEDGTKDNIFISKSYDASSHFESMTDDVKDIYFRINGSPLVLKTRQDGETEE